MPPLNTVLTSLHLFRDMIPIRKESSIVFSAIDKLRCVYRYAPSGNAITITNYAGLR